MIQAITTIGKASQEDGFLYYFSTTDCQTCPSKSTCIKPKEDRARVFVRAGCIFTGSQNRYRKRALRLRKMIERKFGEAKKMARLLKERPPARVFQPALAVRAG